MDSITGENVRDYWLHFMRQDHRFYRIERPARWAGRAQSMFKLHKYVHDQELLNLMKGFSPDGKVRLVPGANSPHQPAGWKFRFPTSKDIGILNGLAPTSVMDTIEWIHRQAVSEAVQGMEQYLGPGKLFDPFYGSLLFAKFEHRSSLDHNPDLHTDVLLFDLKVGRDGNIERFAPGEVSESRDVLDAYNKSMAAGLRQELGLPVRMGPEGIQLVGIPTDLTREFSRTTQDDNRSNPFQNRMWRSDLLNYWHTRAETLGWGNRQAKDYTKHHRHFQTQFAEHGHKLAPSQARGNVLDFFRRGKSQSKTNGQSHNKSNNHSHSH